VDRSRIAEFVLSLALPAERASAVTGDFLEEAAARGGLWFWSSVGRTLASQVWEDWRQAPLELAGLGVRGFAVNLAVFAVLALPGLFLNDSRSAILLASCAAAYFTGRWVGRRAPERKLAACLALGVVPAAILVGVLATIPIWGVEKISFSGVAWSDPLSFFAVVYGALKSDGRKPAAQG
jgi:hypothetical protein